MTSIHTYDPADGAALPELPPLPIGVLAVGTAELLQQAADLPQPRYITISTTPDRHPPVRPGAGERPGHHPVGSTVRQRHDQPARRGPRRHRDLVPDRIRLLRHRRHGLCPRPGRTGQQLADQERPSCPTGTSRPCQRLICHRARAAGHPRHPGPGRPAYISDGHIKFHLGPVFLVLKGREAARECGSSSTSSPPSSTTTPT